MEDTGQLRLDEQSRLCRHLLDGSRGRKQYMPVAGICRKWRGVSARYHVFLRDHVTESTSLVGILELAIIVAAMAGKTVICVERGITWVDASRPTERFD